MVVQALRSHPVEIQGDGLENEGIVFAQSAWLERNEISVNSWSCFESKSGASMMILIWCIYSGHAVALPLVSGGYIVAKPPFFRPLCCKLCAVSLALGSEHAVLLTSDGAVYSWGAGRYIFSLETGSHFNIRQLHCVCFDTCIIYTTLFTQSIS